MRPLLMVMLALAFSTEARAATTLASPDSVIQGYIDHAHVPTPSVTLTLIFSQCPGLDGEVRSCTSAQTPTTIWLNHYHDFYHELGHIFDYNVMTDAFRAGFEKITHDTRPWRSSPNSPHEQFAEAYSYCAKSAKSPPWPYIEGYGVRLTPDRFRRICKLVGRRSNERRR